MRLAERVFGESQPVDSTPCQGHDLKRSFPIVGDPNRTLVLILVSASGHSLGTMSIAAINQR